MALRLMSTKRLIVGKLSKIECRRCCLRQPRDVQYNDFRSTMLHEETTPTPQIRVYSGLVLDRFTYSLCTGTSLVFLKNKMKNLNCTYVGAIDTDPKNMRRIHKTLLKTIHNSLKPPKAYKFVDRSFRLSFSFFENVQS